MLLAVLQWRCCSLVTILTREESLPGLMHRNMSSRHIGPFPNQVRYCGFPQLRKESLHLIIAYTHLRNRMGIIAEHEIAPQSHPFPTDF